MTVRERIEKRDQYEKSTFTVIDPIYGTVVCRVSDFYGDMGFRCPPDYPALEYEVEKEEV